MLVLKRVLEPTKRRANKGFGRSPKHDDAASHGRSVGDQARAITLNHIGRKPVLGVDPRLVFVLNFHSQVDPDELRRAGLTLLDGSNQHAVVAFADDPQLAMFNERLQAYSGPIPAGQESSPYQAFFDAIVTMRAFAAQDRISDDCRSYTAGLTEPEELRLDVGCWYPDTAAEATEWLRDVRTAVANAQGRVASAYTNHPAGLLLARVYLPSEGLLDLAQLDAICSIDLLPKPELPRGQFYEMGVGDLPPVQRVSNRSPILGLIDSGVMSGHPLLAGSVLQSESLSPHITDGEDRNGHGTFVASIALYGSLDQELAQDVLTPYGRIVSVAVLDSTNEVPDDSLWESDLAEAISYCADQGAKVINLSINDRRAPFKGPRQHSISAIVDQLAR